ncbi:MAG: hypothetical protein R3F27_05580 [Gammaproteobacteria bacterium]
MPAKIRSLACLAVGCLSGMLTLSAHAAGLVAAGVDCQSSSRCGLYMDISGNASVNYGGSDSFSYQPAWTLGAYRSVTDGAAAMGGGGTSALTETSNFATFGALKAMQSAGAVSQGSEQLHPYYAHASAASWSNIGFEDRLTFNAAPSLTNTMGTMVGRILVSGGVSASPATYPQESSSASAAVTVSGAGTYSVSANGSGAASGGIPAYITFELPVRFNSTDFTALAMWLQTSANGNLLYGFGLSHGFTATSDFASTLEWGGIDSVRDASGNLVRGWGVTSASGFDYSRSYAAQIAAVPAPGALWLLGSGLLGMIGVARRRGGLRRAPPLV